MRRPLPTSRFRRVGKWTLLALSIVLAGAFLVSIWVPPVYVRHGNPDLIVSIHDGGIRICQCQDAGPLETGWYAHYSNTSLIPFAKFRGIPSGGWTTQLYPSAEHVGIPRRGWAAPLYRLTFVPFWPALALCAFLTAIIWTRDILVGHPARVRRNLLRIGVAMSAATIGLWGISTVVKIDLYGDHAFSTIWPGEVWFGWNRNIIFDRAPSVERHPFDRGLVLPKVYSSPRFVSIAVPFWTLLLATSVPIISSWERRRRRPGHCRVCNYDLRASKRRCPECGTPFAPLKP